MHWPKQGRAGRTLAECLLDVDGHLQGVPGVLEFWK
jgi:hypothetical protein